MNNFKFLEKIDKNIYDIISDAERLYRDEYFEQSISQTRRFGENICKNILSESSTSVQSFDEMLATLKDNATKSIQEKEFVEDLYFLKREGNKSIHSSSVKKDGIIALECLQRAFEVAINYAVYYKKANSNILKKQYDTELLVTGKKSKSTLSERYIKEKNKTKKQKNTKQKKQIYKEKKLSKIFVFLLSVSSIISVILMLTVYLLTILI